MKKHLYLLLAFTLAGCHKQLVQNEHMLTINPKGNAYKPGTCNGIGEGCDEFDSKLNTELSNEKSRPEFETHIDNLLSLPSNQHCETDKNNQKNCQKIKGYVVYIHGGLNTPSNHIDKANQLVSIIEATGYKPIFVDWRSGLITTYTEHLLFDRQGEYWPIAGPLTAPFILLNDLGRGIYKIPTDLWELFSNFSKSHILGSDKAPSEANAYKITQNANKNSNFEGFEELPNLSDDRNTGENLYDFSTDIVQNIASATTLPLFDAIGTGAWETMKRRTELLFVKDKPHYSLINEWFNLGNHKEFSSYESISQYSQNRTGDLAHFFSALLQKQKNHKKPNPSDMPIEIILVGHSMGSIVANKALELFPDLEYSKIIYMGAACSLSDYRRTVLPYLRSHTQTDFYNFTLHPVSENTEANGGGFAGTGSLLVQIDNMYESAASEDKRTLGRWSNMMNGINYFDNGPEDTDACGKPVRKRISLRTMPIGCGFPQKHGDFDEYEFVHTHGRFWLGTLGNKLDRHTTHCQ